MYVDRLKILYYTIITVQFPITIVGAMVKLQRALFGVFGGQRAYPIACAGSSSKLAGIRFSQDPKCSGT